MNSEIPSAAPGGVSVEQALRVALALHRDGELADAGKLYRRILETFPEQPDALHFLGLLARQEGRRDEAIDLMRRAIAAAPDYASAHTNLGNLLCEGGDLEGARRSLLRALELAPDDPRVLNNLGNLERALGRTDKALEAFERAARLAPDFALPYENLGKHYYRIGDIARAHDYFCSAVVHDPSLCYSKQFMGMALAHLGRLDDARTYYLDWIEAEPEDPIPRHLLTTVSEDLMRERAADGYVRAVFDTFASTFEVHLQRLHYRAPELVIAALRADGVEPAAQLDILDAGCGTGLCGPLLRPFARRLDGVDLSPGMLEKARAAGHYDELAEAELTAFIAHKPARYDVIACADTLCYFGDLGPVAKAGASALRAQGRFAFSVERAEAADAPLGYCIRHSGRYAHTEEYLREVLAREGLQVRAMAAQMLRMEAGTPVNGLIVVAAPMAGA
jgi:predicted TPR repeat methyltransferase